MRAVIGSCIDTARRTRYALATIAMIISPGTTLAEILSCRDQDMTVEAPTAELANRVCSVAKASRERLASCHLRQTEPFRIEVKNDLPPEYHGCFGIYLCDESLVQVLTPDSLAEAVKREGIFTEVPIDVFFESVLIHEISHVFAYQSSSGPPGQRRRPSTWLMQCRWS